MFQIAWFASNCKTGNNRLQYVRELQEFMNVDIFGSCGTERCPPDDIMCDSMLQQGYKFYLAFEDSNCRDYITAKFFQSLRFDFQLTCVK